MAERQTRTVVGYAVDRASIQQVVVGNQAIRDSIEGVRDVLGDLNPATAASVNMLNTRFDALGRNIEDDRRIVEDLRAELEHLDNTVVEPEIRVQRSGGGGGGRRNDSGLETTDRLGSVASQLLSGLGQGELANVAGVVGDIAGGVSSLGALGIAAAALAPAISLATSAVQKNEERERNRAQVIEDAAQIIYDATTKEIDARIRGYQNEIAQRQLATQIIEEETGRNADYLANLNDFSLANTSAAASIPQVIDLVNGLGAQAAKVDENNQAIENANYAIELLTRYRESETVATNDSADAANAAAEAEQRLADERRNAFVDEARRAGQDLANRANDRLEIDRMTAEQRQTRAAEIQRQIELLSGDRNAYLAQQTTAGGQAAYLLGQQIAELQDELIRLTDTTETYADKLAKEEAFRKALSAQTESYFDAVTVEVKAQGKAFEARQEYAQAVAEGATKERALATETVQKREEIITESRDRLTDIEDKGAKERARILRDFTRSYNTAVGERDALVGKNAKIAASDRLNDQQESYDEQLRTQTKALDKQLKALDKSYNDQYARLVQGLNAELTTRQQAINRAVVDVANAENYKTAIASSGAGTQRSIHEYMWGQINQTAVMWASNTVSSVRGIMGAYTGSYATQYPMSVGGQQPVTLNYNVTGTQNAVTTTQFRNLLQAAQTRSGGGSAYQ